MGFHHPVQFGQAFGIIGLDPDVELVRACGQGDHFAFDEFYMALLRIETHFEAVRPVLAQLLQIPAAILSGDDCAGDCHETPFLC